MKYLDKYFSRDAMLERSWLELETLFGALVPAFSQGCARLIFRVYPGM